MSSILKTMCTFGAGVGVGVYARSRAHFREAFTLGDFTVYYPYQLKSSPNEETRFEKVSNN